MKEQIQNYTAKLHATEESLKAQVKLKGVINNQHNLEVKSLKSEKVRKSTKSKYISYFYILGYSNRLKMGGLHITYIGTFMHTSGLVYY